MPTAGCLDRTTPGGETDGDDRPTGRRDGTETTGGDGSDGGGDGDGDVEVETEATLTVSGGLTPRPWEHTVTVTPTGRLAFLHRCPNSDRRITGEMRLSGGEHDRFRRLVTGLNLSSLRDRYACEETCPTDLPGTTLTLRVGDRTREVYFYEPPPGAVPDRLGRLLSTLHSYADRFEYDCSPVTTTPSPNVAPFVPEMDGR